MSRRRSRGFWSTDLNLLNNLEGGSGEEELETSEVSAAARRRFRRGAVAGITCGDVTGKDGAWTRRLVRCGGGDSAVRLERSRLRLRRAFRLVSNSKAFVMGRLV